MKKQKELIIPAAPSSIETAQVLGIAINDPKRELAHFVHRDGDVETTLEAIAVDKQITALAKARGVEVDEALTLEALAGLQHGTSTQSTMARYVDRARRHEAAAAEMARASVATAIAAEKTAEARLAVPQEEITHPKLGRGNRAQFELMHDELQHAASVRESAGIYDHHDEPPRSWVRHSVEGVVALSEAMLVTRRLANASWASPATMALFLGLSVILFLGITFVTRGVGKAIADYREMRSAVYDLTAVATDDGGVA